LGLSLDAPAVRPARPRSPTRATWRSFIDADDVASCDASGVVGIGVVVMWVEERRDVWGDGRKEEDFASW
jgi:hypothetical protein